MTTDAKAIYQGSLRNTHAVEAQGLSQMENQVNTLDPYPAYKSLIQRHIETTKRQLMRIETALGETGGDTSSFKDAVTSAAGTIGTVFHRLQQDATLKNLYAGYAYQHEQIAAYESLKVLAKAAGFAAHGGWIDETLDEERAAAKEVKSIIAPVTEQYLQLSLEPA